MGLRFVLTSLIRVQWGFPLPKIFIHEKLESFIKWSNRIISVGGAFICFLALPTIWDLIAGFVLLIIGWTLEKVVFEYTVIIAQAPPEFPIDLSEWITNGYLFPDLTQPDAKELPCYFGPTFETKKYAEDFFEYLLSWNQYDSEDKANNICISFIKEVDNSYTTFLYANPDRKWIDESFSKLRQELKLEKHGKRQQNILFQMVFWKTLPIKSNTLFFGFLDAIKNKPEYLLTAFYFDNKKSQCKINAPEIRKFHFTYKERESVRETDIEYRLGQTEENRKYEYVNAITQEDTWELIQKQAFVNSLMKAGKIRFILGRSDMEPPVIYLVFDDHVLAHEAYSRLRNRITNHLSGKIIRNDHLEFILILDESEKVTVNLKHDKVQLQQFLDSDQSAGKIALLFGFEKNGKVIMAADNNPFEPILIDDFSELS